MRSFTIILAVAVLYSSPSLINGREFICQNRKCKNKAITKPISINCTTTKSCTGSDLVSSSDIICSADSSCLRAASLTAAGDITCSGEQSCASIVGDFISSGGDIECSGIASCKGNTELNAANDIILSGLRAGLSCTKAVAENNIIATDKFASCDVLEAGNNVECHGEHTCSGTNITATNVIVSGSDSIADALVTASDTVTIIYGSAAQRTTITAKTIIVNAYLGCSICKLYTQRVIECNGKNSCYYTNLKTVTDTLDVTLADTNAGLTAWVFCPDGGSCFVRCTVVDACGGLTVYYDPSLGGTLETHPADCINHPTGTDFVNGTRCPQIKVYPGDDAQELVVQHVMIAMDPDNAMLTKMDWNLFAICMGIFCMVMLIGGLYYYLNANRNGGKYEIIE